MLTLLGAMIVVIVVVNFLFILWKAQIPADGRPDKRTVARSEDDPGKTLMRRARYIVRQDTEDRVLASASPSSLLETRRPSWSPHFPEADPQHLPVSEEPVDAVAEPVKISSPSPVDRRSPGLAKKVAAGEVPEPATVR